MSKCIYFASCKKRKFANKKVSISCTIFLALTLVYKGMLLKPFRESEDIFVNSWLSWFFLLFLLWLNSKLSPRVTSWLSRLFWEYNSRFSEKAKNLRAFPGFSEPKIAWKSQESHESRSFLGSPGFFLQGQLTYRKILPNLVDSSLCVGF